jgi:hypothetical protein
MARKKSAKKREKEATPPPPSAPKPTALSTRTAVGIGVLVLGVLAIVSGLRSSSEKEAETRASEVKQAPAKDPHDTPAPTTDLGASKQRQAAALWVAFDKLPAAERTKAKLTDTLDAAAQLIKAEPRAESDRKNLEQQGMEFRKRAAPMASPGARATGDTFATLVPSGDPARCLELGQTWSGDGANMAMLGFRRIECPGSPPKVWELKP